MPAMVQVVERGRSMEDAASTLQARHGVINLEAGDLSPIVPDTVLIEDGTRVGDSSTLAVDHLEQPAASGSLQSVAIPIPVQKRTRSPVSNVTADSMPSLEQVSKRPRLEHSAGLESQEVASNTPVCPFPSSAYILLKIV